MGSRVGFESQNAHNFERGARWGTKVRIPLAELMEKVSSRLGSGSQQRTECERGALWGTKMREVSTFEAKNIFSAFA